MLSSKFLKFLPVLALFIMPFASFAAGIQVSPAKLDFTVTNGQAQSQYLTVINPTADVQVYEVYPDDFTDIIKPLPASFTLESGGKKTVIIGISASGKKTGERLAANLSVVGKPLADNKFSVGTGVKIPVTITIASIENKPFAFAWAYWIFGGLALIAVLILIKYRIAKKTSQ